MATNQILIRIPEQTAEELKSLVPARGRNKFIVGLIEKAVKKEEAGLSAIGRAVTREELKNAALRKERQVWQKAVSDGF